MSMSNTRVIVSFLLVLQLVAPLMAVTGPMTGYWEGDYSLSVMNSIEGQDYCGGEQIGKMKICIYDGGNNEFMGDITLIVSDGGLVVNNAPYDCIDTFSKASSPSEIGLGEIVGSSGTTAAGATSVSLSRFGSYPDFTGNLDSAGTTLTGTFGGTDTYGGLIIFDTGAGTQTIMGTVSSHTIGSYSVRKITDEECFTFSDTCTSSLQCQYGYICSGGWCVEAECTSGSDCPAGQTCSDGECIQEKCSSNSDCAYQGNCAIGKCVCGYGGECVECVGDSQCPAGEICRTGWICQKGQREICMNSADCPGGMICLLGKCYDNTIPECEANSDCSSDFMCIENRCIPKMTTECEFNSECPKGMQCFGFDCVPKTPPIRLSTYDTPYGTVKIEVKVDVNGIITSITVNGIPVQQITGDKYNIEITEDFILINNRPIKADEGVLILEVTDLPVADTYLGGIGIIDTSLINEVAINMGSGTAIVFDRCLICPGCNMCACEYNEFCDAGSCCGHTCTNVSNDAFNCGACGNKCDLSQHLLCFDGKCQNPLDYMNITDDTDNGGNEEPGFFSGIADIFSGFFKWLAGLFG